MQYTTPQQVALVPHLILKLFTSGIKKKWLLFGFHKMPCLRHDRGGWLGFSSNSVKFEQTKRWIGILDPFWLCLAD